MRKGAFGDAIHCSIDTHPGLRVIPVAEAQNLDAEAAGNAEHGPASVVDLGLAVAVERGLVLAQAEGVESVGAAEGQRDVGRVRTK